MSLACTRWLVIYVLDIGIGTYLSMVFIQLHIHKLCIILCEHDDIGVTYGQLSCQNYKITEHKTVYLCSCSKYAQPYRV